MRENHLHCPVCVAEFPVDGPEAKLEFAPIAARLQADGTFEWGEDTWLDYWHMACGTKCRLHYTVHWDRDLFDYVHDGEVLVEIDVPAAGESDGSVQLQDADGSPETWGPTLETLIKALETALSNFKKETT